MEKTRFFLIRLDDREIDTRKIFYIEIVKKNRDIKKIHLADSTVSEWRTRCNAKNILDLFGRMFFVQINRNFIANKRHICGRSSDWKILHLSFFIGCYGQDGFLTQRINVGKGFLPNIKRYIFEPYVEIKDHDGDINLVNPIDVIYVELTKEIKTVYLAKSYPVSDNKIAWQTRLSAAEIMKKFQIDGLFQVHRNYIVNRLFPFKPDHQFKHLFLKSNKKNPALSDIKIPIGATFKYTVIG